MTKSTVDMIFGVIIIAAIIALTIVEHYRRKAFEKRHLNIPEFLKK